MNVHYDAAFAAKNNMQFRHQVYKNTNKSSYCMNVLFVSSHYDPACRPHHRCRIKELARELSQETSGQGAQKLEALIRTSQFLIISNVSYESAAWAILRHYLYGNSPMCIM